ncbi:MAG: DNA helicase UvrD [Deltaproteobacteria bacterium]|nr:DNA helicase UvrD [Deltaproteobacteria bacterium]
MRVFLADLHIHSRFSRATSKKLTFRNLAAWGSLKGIDLLATGDFTHPAWFSAIREELVPEEGGIFRLKESGALGKEIPGAPARLPCRTKFILGTEISLIYKRLGKVRKVHNLVFMPSVDSAERFNRRLEQVGNLASDGRPILGLDSHDLLEMVLETDPGACLIPAHVWTPWFSLFGSKSGFDRIEDCFGDLAGEIFALETGLSSDPDMNWLLSALDRFRLISNSDAHSGENLGREVNIFAGEMDYHGIFRALKGLTSATEFRGTVEFFPEEGKYHLDGHRKCNVVLEPRQTRQRAGLCPVCGGPLTVGVLSRVQELADRSAPRRPEGHPGFVSLIPLPELVAETLGVGPKSKKVRAQYLDLVAGFGSEMDILRRVPPEDIRTASPLLAEAVRRMRAGEVHRKPGFDGEYGVISAFTPQEREVFLKGRRLPGLIPGPKRTRKVVEETDVGLPDPGPGGLPILKAEPDEDQIRAVKAGPGPVLVLAGPGTGKTFTLVHRVRHLLEAGQNPEGMLVLTFTRRAAGELRDRLAAVGPKTEALKADTVHALAFGVWSELLGQAPVLLGEEDARRTFALANPELGRRERKVLWQELSLARERREDMGASPEVRAYADRKAVLNLVDYTDLLEFWIQQIDSGNYTKRFDHVLVDEVQDMSRLQLELLQRLLASSGDGLFAIGDPRQSIYGFRGAEPEVDKTLRSFWPELETVSLSSSHRSGQTILDLGGALFPHGPRLRSARLQEDTGQAIMFTAVNAAQESAWIGEKILALLGGTAHWQADQNAGEGLGPGDIAVLVRLWQMVPSLRATLDKMGIPCSVPGTDLFFHDPRVAAIIDEGRRVLGLGGAEGEERQSQIESLCPDATVVAGPLVMADSLAGDPRFPDVFFKSRPFRDLAALYAERSGWAGVLREVALQSELEAVRQKSQKVQIMTLHAAKGLEFEAVFLPGLEDGLIPLADLEMLTGQKEAGADPKGGDVEEERRLFYVGLTRAANRLYLSRALERKLYGRAMRLPESRFLGELPENLVRLRKAKAHVQIRQKALKMDF